MNYEMGRRDALNLIRKIGLVAGATVIPWKLFDSIGAGSAWIADAQAGVLPLNYSVQTGQALADTSTGIAGLVSSGVSGGDAVWSLSEVTTASFLRPLTPTAPTKVLKLMVTTPGTVNSTYQMDWTVSIVPRLLSQVWVIGRGENLGGGDHSGVAFLSEDGTFANYWTWNFGYSTSSGDESVWRYLQRNKTAFSVGAGAPNANNTFTRLRLRLGANAGTSPTYYICPTWVNVYSKPVLTIGFDDRNLTDYTNAYAYMQPRNLPGYCALTSGIGTNTVPNLLTMQDNGWSMHNHSHSHPDFTTLNAGQMRSEVEQCRDYLSQNGLNTGTLAFVYPFGSRNALSDSVLSSYYRYTMLANSASADQVHWDGMAEPLRVTRAVFDTPTSAATMIANINAAVARGNAMNLYGHDVTAGAGAGKTDLTVFQTVMDHVYRLRNGNVVQVRNLQEMITGLTYPRFVRP